MQTGCESMLVINSWIENNCELCAEQRVFEFRLRFRKKTDPRTSEVRGQKSEVRIRSEVKAVSDGRHCCDKHDQSGYKNSGQIDQPETMRQASGGDVCEMNQRMSNKEERQR